MDYQSADSELLILTSYHWQKLYKSCRYLVEMKNCHGDPVARCLACVDDFGQLIIIC